MPLAESEPQHPSASERINNRLLSFWLAALCLLSGVAAFQALLLPRWPRSGDPSAKNWSLVLRRAGLRPRLLPALPGQRNAERALSRVLRWELADGDQLSLLEGTVSRRANFQTAFLTRDIPGLKLAQRRVDGSGAGSDSGLIDARPALQTCLVPQADGPAMAATTALALGQAADRRVRGRLETLRGLLGLQPTRSFSCVLVTPRSGSSRPLPAGLWPRLLPVLQSALSDPGRG